MNFLFVHFRRLECVKMSDSENSTSDRTEKSMDQEPKEPSSPPRDEPSADAQGDSSTDVTPTRKTRKRPELKPPAEEQKNLETPQSAESAPNVGFYHTFTNIINNNYIHTHNTVQY